MRTILLSVCIPAYNRAAYIEETLESIISQDNGKIEIIISDNASVNDSDKILKSHAEKYDYITYVRNEKNIGADLNYINVVRQAKGKYCVIFGSDDILLPGAIEDLCSILEANDHDYLFFDRKHGTDINNSHTQHTFYEANVEMRLNKTNEAFIKY